MTLLANSLGSRPRPGPRASRSPRLPGRTGAARMAAVPGSSARGNWPTEPFIPGLLEVPTAAGRRQVRNSFRPSPGAESVSRISKPHCTEVRHSKHGTSKREWHSRDRAGAITSHSDPEAWSRVSVDVRIRRVCRRTMLAKSGQPPAHSALRRRIGGPPRGRLVRRGRGTYPNR